MANDLRDTLEILDALRRGGECSAASLCALRQCSVATLKRRLSDARELGAHVESIKVGPQWWYHLANAAQVERVLDQWLQLERARSLV